MSIDARLSEIDPTAPFFQVLALSGGGFRGLFTARVLSLLEERLETEKSGRQLRDCFNLIAGTSVGGLLAVGLASGLRAKELEDTIAREGSRVFDRRIRLAGVEVPIHRPRGPLGRLFSAPYRAEHLRRVATELLGNRSTGYIQELERHAVVTAVEDSTVRPAVFGSRLDSMSQYNPITTMDAILATTAAPTYFPPHRVGNSSFIDGGIIANAPDLVGIVEAVHTYGIGLDRIRILSIGTGSPARSRPPVPSNSTGILEWMGMRRLFLTTIESQENLAMDMARNILRENWNRIDAWPSPDEAPHLEMDEASENSKLVLCRLADGAVKLSENVKIGDMLRHNAK